jgi:D-hydroxyproline dehydrogenase subunit beta
MHASADVVVVGGGIVGCAAAYELARGGAKVILLERDELAAGASGRNHGLLVSPLDPGLVPMASTSLDVYRAFVADSPIPLTLDRDPIGYLIVGSDDHGQHEAGEGEARAAESCGVHVDRLTSEEVVRLEPDISPEAAAEVWLLDDVRRVQPGALTTAFALAARSLGAEIGHHLGVRILLTVGPSVRGVVTDEGTISTDTVVLAAGPWTGPLYRPLGIDLPMTAARGWLVGLAPSPVPFTRVLGRAGWHSPPDPEGVPRPKAGEVMEALPEAAIGSLLHPSADGTVLVGGSRQFAFTSEPEDPAVPQRLLRNAIRLVPALADAPVLAAWWGLRPMTPDGRPLVGAIADGLIVATGHGSLGVTLAAGTARLVTALVSGDEPPFEPTAFDPARFGDRESSPA